MSRLDLTIGDGAKSVAVAIKHVCNSCQNLSFVWRHPSTLSIFQQSDNGIAWVEMLLEIQPSSAPRTDRAAWTVDSKSLAAAMRDVSTLKDTIGLHFFDDHLVVKTPKSSYTLTYQTGEAYRLDTSPCCGANAIAGKLTGLETKTLEIMIADALATGGTVRIAMQKDGVGEAEKIAVGTSNAIDDVVLSVKESGYAAEFDGETLRQFVKNSIAAEVSLQLYDGLPMKLLYSLNKKKKVGKKKAAASSTTSPDAVAINATLQVFISPRSG